MNWTELNVLLKFEITAVCGLPFAWCWRSLYNDNDVCETSKRRVTFLSLIFLVKIELTEDILHSILAHCGGLNWMWKKC